MASCIFILFDFSSAYVTCWFYTKDYPFLGRSVLPGRTPNNILLVVKESGNSAISNCFTKSVFLKELYENIV